MQDQKKVYGFTLSLFEYIETIPTLWDAVKGALYFYVSLQCSTARTDTTEFIDLYPEHISEDNAMAFLSDDGGETYNKCHCTST